MTRLKKANNYSPLGLKIRARPQRRNAYFRELNKSLQRAFSALFMNRGSTVGRAYDSYENLCGGRSFWNSVDTLIEIGAVTLGDEELILENTILSPLERLARASD